MQSKYVKLSNEIREKFPSTAKSASLRKLIYGKGVNDADYLTQVLDGDTRVICRCYSHWKAMLCRVYSRNYQEVRPTYAGVMVCDEWHSFMKFRKWWIDNYVDGWCLDKDLCEYGSKIYSPETCAYVPNHINNFISKDRKRGSGTAIGTAYYPKLNKYHAHVRSFENKKLIGIGFFETEIEANNAWKEEKIKHAASMKSEMDSIDPRIYHGVLKMINDSW